MKREQTVDLKCQKPDYLKPGDKVALISPSYFTPMENVEKTAEVLRNWGLEPVIGPNVGKVVDGRYAGTVSERVSDIRWALDDPSIKAIICNRGGYDTFVYHRPQQVTARYLCKQEGPGGRRDRYHLRHPHEGAQLHSSIERIFSVKSRCGRFSQLSTISPVSLRIYT